MNEKLGPRREIKAKEKRQVISKKKGVQNIQEGGESLNGEAIGFEDKVFGGYRLNNKLDDIVIQEYVTGKDYSCVVMEMNDTLVALAPTIYRYPTVMQNQHQFLSWDVK